MTRTLLLFALLVACSGSEPTPADSPDLAPTDTPTRDTAAVAAPSVQVTPAAPRAGLDALLCEATGSDSLGWTVDGVATEHGADVPAADVSPGTWTCTAEGPGGSASDAVSAVAVGGNVLLLLLDDVGLDKVSVYPHHPAPPATPRMDALAAEGVRFDNAYALPLCSPTRAALMTGRYPSRTGVGALIPSQVPEDFFATEDMLPQMLKRSAVPYATSMTGKWHLSNIADVEHPSRSGFDWHGGSMNNPKYAVNPSPQGLGYLNWEKNTNGVLAFSDTYMTTDTVDDAIDQLQTLPEPWLLYVPFNAAHEPWHSPDPALSGIDPATLTSTIDQMDAMVQALDTEMGRLLDAMTEAQRANTTIILMGDNGTQGPVMRPPSQPGRGKSTLYEGGIRVPLIVVAPWVDAPGRVSDALVHVVDVFPTAAALAGVSLDDGIHRDGLSWLPLIADVTYAWPREYLFAEKQNPNGPDPYRRWFTLRDHDHKLKEGGPDGPEFFELTEGSLDEGQNLLTAGTMTPEQQAAHARLVAEGERITGDLWATP